MRAFICLKLVLNISKQVSTVEKKISSMQINLSQTHSGKLKHHCVGSSCVPQQMTPPKPLYDGLTQLPQSIFNNWHRYLRLSQTIVYWRKNLFVFQWSSQIGKGVLRPSCCLPIAEIESYHGQFPTLCATRMTKYSSLNCRDCATGMARALSTKALLQWKCGSYNELIR